MNFTMKAILQKAESQCVSLLINQTFQTIKLQSAVRWIPFLGGLTQFELNSVKIEWHQVDNIPCTVSIRPYSMCRNELYEHYQI